MVEAASEAITAPTATVSAGSFAETDEGWSEISQTLALPYPASDVWQRLQDYRLVANCLPGAAIDNIEGDRIDGRFRAALGPIAAEFHGVASIETSDADRRGRLRGSGSEKSGATAAKGELSYAVRDAGDGCQVDLAIRYRIQGRLAQFTRSGIVADFVERLTGQFAENLAAAMEGGEQAPAAEPLHVGGIFLAVLWARIKRLFGG